MLERLNYYWRLCGTGLSFFLFGAMGILIWGLLFPLFEPFLGRRGDKKRRTRRLMQGIFRVYMNFMRVIGILNYQVQGRREQLLADGNLVIANHPCLLDIVFLISQIPNATCIVKPALIRNPFMRIPIRAMGYIYAEDPEMLVTRCAEELNAGSSLIIFPEGTRTTPGKAIKFQRGAAAIALQAEAKLLPVTIGCHPTTLTKREKWYQIPEKRFTLSLFVGDHIRLTPISEHSCRSQITRQSTRQLEAYFIEQLAQHGKS
ncbi:MAG: 1-acyl-sn-glycerol-3-phosphate acyltransferase [Methylomonas sp.]|jgi:1-acyl-sn-glycerol-3-phosphate acyltransferase|uniref:lysophospholipid acyltransferase family protein n=1 Tax=Methylomonas sp. TaxID=418 RepID=UPI0025F076DE|nr:lysophospholipid acyltransferase family protein [Methylomonas sp.]MCK9606576.1 1-acyl-sn-glycerol-3-phosphate acyltransferase [Methylomonas sp.]